MNIEDYESRIADPLAKSLAKITQGVDDQGEAVYLTLWLFMIESRLPPATLIGFLEVMKADLIGCMREKTQ